jgi:hypothetical protein
MSDLDSRPNVTRRWSSHEFKREPAQDEQMMAINSATSPPVFHLENRSGSDLDSDSKSSIVSEDSIQQEAGDEAPTKLEAFLTSIELVIIALIVVNSIMIGMATFDFVEKNEKVNKAFETADTVFLYIFTVELFMHLTVYFRVDRIRCRREPRLLPATPTENRRRKKNLPWMIFDSIIVIIAWSFMGGGSVLRAFRVLRALRLVSKIKALKNLCRAMLHVCPKMGALAFITVVLLLIFGISTTVLFKDLYLGEGVEGSTTYNYFGSFDRSLLTLFQMMTFDNWHDPAREIMDIVPYSWTIFVLWVFISGFVIMNLIIAVICESIVQMNDMGLMALKGQTTDEAESIRELDERGDLHESSLVLQAHMDLRLLQLEGSITKLLETETEILELLQKKLPASSRSRSKSPLDDNTAGSRDSSSGVEYFVDSMSQACKGSGSDEIEEYPTRTERGVSTDSGMLKNYSSSVDNEIEIVHDDKPRTNIGERKVSFDMDVVKTEQEIAEKTEKKYKKKKRSAKSS